MKQNKITFLFNQLMTESLCTGGDIRGRIIAQYFSKETNYQVEIVTPEIALNEFKKFKTIIIGHQHFEKKLNHQTLISAFILFCRRTVEMIYQQSVFKTDILYSTGDFFCNIIPSFFIKILRPQTKFVVCIHHINQNPFKRKSNSFLANSISFVVQQLSLALIKTKSDLIFVVNQQVKQYLISKKFHQPIIVSGNGLDIQEIEAEINSLKLIKPSNHICYFGRLSPTKGTMDFPKILSQMIKNNPKIHLDLIGIALPEITQPLIEKFNRYNCQGHYTIHGFIEKKTDVFKIVLKSKVIVFPSYEEGWGISLFESIMTKRPVIAYNLPIFCEIFHNKLKTVPIGNVDQLSKNVSTVFEKYNSPKIKQYISSCYKIARSYDWQHVYTKEKNAIDKIICQNK